MSDCNPYQSPLHEEESETLRKGPDSFLASVRQGVWLGFKWVSLTIRPTALLLLLVTLGVTAYRLCFLEGSALLTDPDLRWETLRALGCPFGLYFVSCMWGVIAGLLVCPIVYLIRRITG